MRLLEDIAEALLEVVFVDATEALIGRERDVREGFFCSDGGGWLGRESDESEGFLRNWSVEGGERNWP